MVVMAAPQPLDDTKLFLLSRLVGEHFVGSETGRICLATFFARQLNVGSANFEGFYISISTYSYNPLLSSCSVTDERARNIRALLRAIRDRRWSRSWRRTTLFEGLWISPSTLRGIRYDVFRYIDFVKFECWLLRPQTDFETQYELFRTIFLKNLDHIGRRKSKSLLI